jgi:hypothetical protein
MAETFAGAPGWGPESVSCGGSIPKPRRRWSAGSAAARAKICGDRAVMMPKRRHTRANLQRSITAERRIIDGLVAERDKPPPF